MMKLKRYLKPYIGFALAAIVLMFCQAAVDLNLPNLMSDIVNVGIQQGGITEAAPKAVSAEGLQLMSAFMSEEDRALAQSQYVLAEQANMTADEWDRFVTDWPKVSDTDVYRQIPNLDDSTQAQLDSAFSRASYALMTVVKDLAEQSGQDIAAGDTDSKAMDMSKLGELVPVLAMLPQLPRWGGFGAALSVLPVLFFCLWLVVFYKENAANPILWAYGMEILAIAMCLLAVFRLSAYLFYRAKPRQTIFACMLALITSLATLTDSVSLGARAVLGGWGIGAAVMCWVIINNFVPPAPEEDTY